MKVITTAGIEGWVRGSAYTAAGENEVILVWPSEASFENGGTDASELRKRNMDVIEEEADYDTMADALSEEFEELEEDITPPPVVLPIAPLNGEHISKTSKPVETNVSVWSDLVVGDEVEITLRAGVDDIIHETPEYVIFNVECFGGIISIAMTREQVIDVRKRIVLTPGAVYNLSFTNELFQEGLYIYGEDNTFKGIELKTVGHEYNKNVTAIKTITKE